MKRHLLASFFVFVGVFSLLYGQELHREQTSLPMVQAKERKNSTDQHTIESIQIPSLALDLPVYEAVIHNDVWQTTKYGVSHLSSSPLPGEQGNSVLYAHNWKYLFGQLDKLQPQDEITFRFSDGTSRIVRVLSSTLVGQADTSILSQEGTSRVTLYTCAGIFDSQRRVVTAH